jgi:hypothetical protein
MSTSPIALPPIRTLEPFAQDPKALGRQRLVRVRARLLEHRVASIRIVYYASGGHRFVTLCATPIDAQNALIELPACLTDGLLRLFERWMALTHPQWADGPDAAGVLDWNLRVDTFAHRHSSYRQQLFSTSHRG